MKQLIFIAIVLILISSCDNTDKNKNNQGVITYNITYPEDIANKGFATFLPGKMTTIYKGDHYKFNISGEFNIYNLEYISRSNGDTCFTLFKIFDKRLFYPQNEDEDLFLFEKHNNPDITFFSDSNKVIAGMNCKKAVAVFDDKDIPKMEMYYTEDIDFNLPNANTPFKEIPGTLLEFTIFYQGLNLSLRAESVKLKEIKEDEFTVPGNYRQTDANEINDIVASLLEL